MRKEEFLSALRAGLTGLSPEGTEKLAEFCSEMIDDRMEDGLKEEEAVAAAGPLDELIKQAKAELPPAKTANFPEKSTFGDTLRTYTAEGTICGVTVDCGPADFQILPAENNICRVECTENETVRYAVTTENSVLHIRRADSRTVFSFFKFYRTQRSEPVRVYLPQGAYKSLEIKTTSGDITVPAGYTFDTATLHGISGDIACRAACGSLSVHTASGDIACCAAFGTLSAETASGDIALKSVKCGTAELCAMSGDAMLENIKFEKNAHIETASGKVQITNLEAAEFDVETTSGSVKIENAACAVLQVGTASGDAALTHTVSANSLKIGTASGSIRLENCDAAALMLESSSGNIIGTLNTGKIFRASSRSGKIDVPPDSGEGHCTIDTRSGSIKIKIAE